MPPPAIRLVTVPAVHPYVSAVRPDGVQPVAVGRVRGWDPDPYLDPASVPSWADGVDLVHLHFGFDHLDADTLRAWITALDVAHLPLVFTAHDLRNPHHADPAPHTAMLDVLMERAAAVLTLTDGAAREISERWGRAVEAIAHPTLVDPDLSEDTATEAGLATVHLKSLRRNLCDPVELVRAAAAGAAAAGGRLRVDVHPAVIDSPRLRELREGPGIQIVVHQRFSDRELERYVRYAHATVLPHRWGTHSGWLEMARDLGTAVVAPSCGHYRDQWSQVHLYTNDEQHGLDPESRSAAVAAALRAAPPAPADRETRLAEANAGRARHEALYREVLAGVDR